MQKDKLTKLELLNLNVFMLDKYNKKDKKELEPILNLKNPNLWDYYLIVCALCNYLEVKELEKIKTQLYNTRQIIHDKLDPNEDYKHRPEDYVGHIELNTICKNLNHKNKYNLYEYEITNFDDSLIQILWSWKEKDCLKFVSKENDRLVISIGKDQLFGFMAMLDELGIKYDASDIQEGLWFTNISNNELIDLKTLDLPFTPYDFQIEDAEKLVHMKRALLGSDMGCIEGSGIVEIKINGTTKYVTLASLFDIFKIEKNIKIKSYVDNYFEFMPIKNVLYQGKKPIMRIITEHTNFKCTLDHEILTTKGWIEAKDLKLNDELVTSLKTKETILGLIEFSKTEPVYDIVIDDDYIRNFVVNNVVVHNCGKTFISILVGSSMFNTENVIYSTLDNLDYNDMVITDKGPICIGDIVENDINCKIQVISNGEIKFVNILDRRCVEE